MSPKDVETVEASRHVCEWGADPATDTARLRADLAALRRQGMAFLENLSLELRTPLTGVVGALDLLERIELASEAKDLVEIAQESAQALLRRIEDLVDSDRMRVPVSGVGEGESPLLGVTPVRVLVAEDNEVNREIATRLLEQLGCQVSGVANGAQALEELDKHPFDLVFMDCRMPVLNGFEATARIRASSEWWRNVPIVALTAQSLPAHAQQCRAAGMDDHLTKPIELEELSRTLARWVG